MSAIHRPSSSRENSTLRLNAPACAARFIVQIECNRAYSSPCSPEQRLEVARAMNDAQNLDTVGVWQVKDKNSFEAFSKDPQRLQSSILLPGVPPDTRLGGKKRESAVSRQLRRGGQVRGLPPSRSNTPGHQGPDLPRPDDVTVFAHRAPAPFRRSSPIEHPAVDAPLPNSRDQLGRDLRNSGLRRQRI